MSYSAIAVANEFIKRSLAAADVAHEVTNMKLQKLVYIAHGYSLGLCGEPLIHNDIHAFEWGPVIPVLYKQLKAYKANRIEAVLPTDTEGPTDMIAEAIIDFVWRNYGQYNGLDLSRLTHKADTPWSKTWAKSKHGVISDEVIREYYQKFVNERADTPI